MILAEEIEVNYKKFIVDQEVAKYIDQLKKTIARLTAANKWVSVSELNFMDETMSDDERLVMQETMYKQDIESLQSKLDAAQEENKRYKLALEDFARHGVRHDLSPTIYIDGAKTEREFQNKLVMFFYNYIKGIDAYVRKQSKSALNGGNNGNSR